MLARLEWLRSMLAGVRLGGWSGVTALARSVVRFLSVHTGLPALFVAAILLALGYRVLRRTARFAVEVAAIALALVAASELGWIRW